MIAQSITIQHRHSHTLYQNDNLSIESGAVTAHKVILNPLNPLHGCYMMSKIKDGFYLENRE